MDVSASCSSTRCPGMRITVEVVCGMQEGSVDCRVDLPRVDQSPGLTDDRLDADWLAVIQSTASDITFMLL